MGMNAYQKLCTEFYNISKPRAPAKALRFYLHHLEAADGPVLEPMCGSGRFLIPVLELGTDIDGIDASPHMLQACRDRCRKKGLKPALYGQLLQELSLPRQYGSIFIPDGSFGLIIDRQAARESLQRLHQHLLPGGRLIVEIETPWARSKDPGRWVGSWVTRPDAATIILSCLSTYDREEGIERAINRYELFKNGHLIETELEDFPAKYYEREEFQQLLEATGFVDIRVNKAYQDAEPGIEDRSIIFRCRKP